jgi:hypothetical protein
MNKKTSWVLLRNHFGQDISLQEQKNIFGQCSCNIPKAIAFLQMILKVILMTNLKRFENELDYITAAAFSI